MYSVAMRRSVGLGLLVIVLGAAAAALALTTDRGRGYLAPVFAPDGATVYVVVRDVNATVVGLGYSSWTPPASVWMHRDRFSLVAVRLSDARLTVVKEFPASPLEGGHFRAYHGAIFGEGQAHLRLADPAHLEYELAVTWPDTPSSRTFVWRRRWSAAAGAFTESTAWEPGSTSMSGDEPGQLQGELEAIAPRGQEELPCALLVFKKGSDRARALAETSECRSLFPDGYTADRLVEFLRRDAIERSQLVETTYADLVAQGRAAGLSEGAAMLQANKGMQRLGLFPKETTIVAHADECGAVSPVFHISDEEFRVGLFQDMEKAIDHPGEAIDKGPEYITHRDYDTSRQVNAFLADRQHREFLVVGKQGCWHMTIVRP